MGFRLGSIGSAGVIGVVLWAIVKIVEKFL